MSDDKDSKKDNKSPPSWGPGSKLTLRKWTEKMRIWLHITDLAPKKIVPNIILKLEGLASDIGNEMTDQELMSGGMTPDGITANPLELLLSRLQHAFGHLDEEIQMHAAREYDDFRRLPQESIDSLTQRFEMMRIRVAKESGLIKPWYDLSRDLLKHANVDVHCFRELTRDYNYSFPDTHDRYNRLVIDLRRLKHITENAPLNIAASFHHGGGSRSHYY